MSRLALERLKYFITVVEAGSTAETPRQLRITQPLISIAIKNLESAFNQQLFIHHRTQGVSLTSSDRRIYDKVKELLRLSWELEQNSRADKEPVLGMISIGCFRSVVPLHIPKLVAGFKKCYSEIILHLYDDEQRELMHGLHYSRFDLASVYDPEPGHLVNKERLNTPRKPYALLPAAYPLVQKAQVMLQELSREPIILLDVVPSKDYFISILKEKGYHPEAAHNLPSTETVHCMVGRGLGSLVLVTRSCHDVTYDGERVVQWDIVDEMPASTSITAHLANNEPTWPT